MECSGKTLSSSPALPCFHAWRLVQMTTTGTSGAWVGHEWKWIRKLGVPFSLVSGSGCSARGSLIPAAPDFSRSCTACPSKWGFAGMAHTSSWERVKNQTSVNGHHSLLSVAAVEKFKMRLSLCSHHLLVVISLYNVYFGAASVFT